MPGALLIGDTAGLLNVPKIKGTHQAIRSGMLAAEHLPPRNKTEGWDAKLRASVGHERTAQGAQYPSRFPQGFLDGPGQRRLGNDHGRPLAVDAEKPRRLVVAGKIGKYEEPKHDYVDRTLPPRDRLAEVYFAATEHDEDQPIHLHVADTNICITKCAVEYDNPCTRFCPAGVYEILGEGADKRLQINAANCVHCKTCDIKDPYQIITWVTPEGGSGPNYQNL